MTVPAGQPSGPAYIGLRIVADPAVPEAGLYDKSGVHRGSDWEPLTIVTPAPAGRPTCRRSMPVWTRKSRARWARARWAPGRSRSAAPWATGSSRPRSPPPSGTLLPRLTLSGPTGQMLIQSDSGQIVQSLQPGTYVLSVSEQAGAGDYRLTTAFTQTSLPYAPLGSGAGTDSVAVGDLNGDGIPDIVTANRIDDTVSVFLGNGDGTFLPPKTYDVGAAGVAGHAGRRDR